MIEPRTPRRHRWRQALTAVSLLALAAAGAWGAAEWATDRIEARTVTDVSAALAAGGFDWAKAQADGLTVQLTGSAPDEVQRFRAVSTAGTVVDAGRIVDRISVAPPAETAPPPPFRLEILRHDDGVSVIGLAPAGLDRAALLRRLGNGEQEGGRVTDLLELADYPAPPHWNAAVEFALTAAALTPRGKISVGADQVEVAAVTDGAAAKARLEQALEAALPAGVTLKTDITAPRPVIAPFVLALEKTGGGLRLTACAADSAAARDRIAAALASAGLPGTPDCALGLGAPSPQWADAAVPAIAALAALPAGRVELRDAEVTLTAPALVPATQFGAARDGLRAALPRMFDLTATLERAPPVAASSPPGFSARVTAEGVALQGAITDDRMRGAVESFAAARFGRIEGDLTADPAVPAGWSLRVIGALEALAALDRGSAEVTPDLIRLAGATGDRNAADALAETLSARIGAGEDYELALRYDPRLDPAIDLPSGTECVDRLNETMQQSEIGFEPNRAVIAGDPDETLARLAEIMARCGDFRLEIGGHTDSQGSDSFNMTLSRDRAQAVAEAMADAGIATANLAVTGYGETRPVGDNATEAGREMNRRIEFRLLSPDPVNAASEPVTVVRGTTRDVGEGGPAVGEGEEADAAAEASAEGSGQSDAAEQSGDAAATDSGADHAGSGGMAPAEASDASAASASDSLEGASSGASAGDGVEKDQTGGNSEPQAASGDAAVADRSDPASGADAAVSDDTPIPSQNADEPTAAPRSDPAAPSTPDSTAPPAPLRPGPIQAGRLPGLPPDLGGEARPLLPAPTPEAAAVTDGDAEILTITPDDAAAAEGISIRPQVPEVNGDRLLTPVPPLLPTGEPVAPSTPSSAASRPPQRPGN